MIKKTHSLYLLQNMYLKIATFFSTLRIPQMMLSQGTNYVDLSGSQRIEQERFTPKISWNAEKGACRVTM